MRTVDVLLATGVVVALGAGAGAAAIHAQPTMDTYAVAWETRTTAVIPVPVQHTGPGATELKVPIDHANLVWVDFQLSVTGMGPRAGTEPLDVQVEGPGGLTATGRGTLAPGGMQATTGVPVHVVVAAAPEPTQVEAANAEEALATAKAQQERHDGHGEWTVRVTFGTAASTLNRPESHRVALTAYAVTYHPVLAAT